MKLLCACLVVIGVVNYALAAKRKPQGKLDYELNLSDDGVKFCDGAEESLIDISGLTVERDTPVSTVLSGEFEFLSPILPGTTAMLIVEKETPQGKVIAYTFESPDLCEHVPTDGMPWSVLVDAMKLDPKDCPLPAKKYIMDALKIDLSKASTVLTHENVGDYSASVQFTHKGDGLDIVEHTIACFDFTFSVAEVRKAAEEGKEEE